MSDTNPNNNDDKKLPSKRDSGSDRKTNQDPSTTRMKKPSVGLLGAMAPHDDPDDAGKGLRYAPTIVPLPFARASNKAGDSAGKDDDSETEFDADRFINSDVRKPAVKQRPQLAPAGPRPPQANEETEASGATTASVAAESQVRPGAFPEPGIHPSQASDDFTVTGQDNTPLPTSDPMVTAHLVDDDEENQDEVRALRQQLNQLQARMDHAVVANVVASEDTETDNKSIHVGIRDEEHDVETGDEAERAAGVDNEQGDTAEAKGAMKSRRNMLIVAGLLVLVAIIVGIAIPLALKEDSKATPSPLSDDLVGKAVGDYFGDSIALSGDGGILAVGAPGNDGNGSNSGSVRVYQRNMNSTTPAWTQLGGDIDGENAYDYFGYSVALSNDGTVLAVGADQLRADGYPSPGYVRVFRFVNNQWTPIGNPINGRGDGDTFGYSVALSADGTIVAGSATWGDYTLVYQLQNGNFSQVGYDIVGYAESVSLSHDGTVLAVGDGFFRLVNNVWTIIGSPITGSGWFGSSVSLSADGSIVAVGAPENDGNDSTTPLRGAAYVYQNVNDEWIQVGSDLYGADAGDGFGRSVSLSDDGTILAVGANQNDSNGEDSGQVRVFHFVNNEWTLIGDPINGRGVNDKFGRSVALSADGTIVAGGAPESYGRLGPGYVLVHRLEEQ